jgi:hypothetical protein
MVITRLPAVQEGLAPSSRQQGQGDFWRLTYDAHPTPSRLHLPTATCGCGVPGVAVDRQHMFWACPVMTAVTISISMALVVRLELHQG